MGARVSNSALFAFVAVAFVACRAAPKHAVAPSEPLTTVDALDEELIAREVPTRELALRDDWSSCGLETFEAWVALQLPGDAPVALARADARTLAAALEAHDLRSLRASVILARSRTGEAYELLLQRLEKRFAGAERADDAADVLAAASLSQARGLGVRNLGKRLEELVIGKEPHPDLEVRVECAATLLVFKRIQGVGFLLRVLRDQTHSANDAKRDWTPTPHMAWPKSRAAMALSRYLEVPCTFRPDASLEQQQDEATKLEALYRAKKRELDARDRDTRP